MGFFLNLTWLAYILAGVSLYYTVLFLISLVRPRAPTGAGVEPLMVLLIPAHNEELVIGETLDAIEHLDYSDYLVMVINDNSADDTGSIVAARAATNPSRCVLVDRVGTETGRGKGAALNFGFETLVAMSDHQDPRLRGRPVDEIIVVIVDADGQLEESALTKVAPYFSDAAVGAVQIGVRIINAASSTLTRLQDMEFVGFSCLVQVARDRLGSVGLGGNGQFNRLSALLSLGRSPWRSSALTEDLDLGLALIENGWRTRYCADAFVAQQGLTRWRPLLRQRTRWIQGHYQCWKHVPEVLSRPGIRLATRLDITVYLTLVVTVMLVAYNLIVGILVFFGVAPGISDIFRFAPPGIVHRAVVFFFTFAPLLAIVITYQRFAKDRCRIWELPTYAVAFTLYSYVWSITTIRAWLRIITRRGGWVKTPRVPSTATIGSYERAAVAPTAETASA